MMSRSWFPFLVILTMLSLPANAVDRRGRLGVGVSNQLKTDTPALSFKLQQSRRSSIAGLASIDTSNQGGFSAGLKIHRHFFEEPNLIFYGAILGAYLSDKRGQTALDVSGFQFDFTVGAEFHFAGLKSLGFHFETGISLNKLDEFVVQTVGSEFLVMGVHFYF